MKEKAILYVTLDKYSPKSIYTTRVNKYFDDIVNHLHKYDVAAINVSDKFNFSNYTYKGSKVKVLKIHSNKLKMLDKKIHLKKRQHYIYPSNHGIEFLSHLLYIYMIDCYPDKLKKEHAFDHLLGASRVFMSRIINLNYPPPYNNLFNEYLLTYTYFIQELKKRIKKIYLIGIEQNTNVYLVYIWIIYNLLHTYYNRAVNYNIENFIKKINEIVFSTTNKPIDNIYEDNINTIGEVCNHMIESFEKYKWFLDKYYYGKTYQLVEEIKDFIVAYKEMYRDNIIVTNESLWFMLNVIGTKYDILGNFYFLISDQIEDEKFYIYDDNTKPHNGLYVSFNIPDCNVSGSLCSQLNIRTKPKKLITYV